MELTISRASLDEIVTAAKASPDAEICGLLLGQGAIVSEVRPCRNVSPDPHDSFELDPAALIAAHRSARDGGPALIGHYHSHPRGPAAPSPRDAAMAEAGSFWIIIGEGEARCWRAMDRGEFAAVPMVPARNP